MRILMKNRLCLFLGIVAVAFVGVSTPANAVGFTVNPMTINCSPQPDTHLEQSLTLFNTQKDGEQLVDVKLLELTQGSDGGWQAVDPKSDPVPPNIRSCLNWVSVSAETVKVASLQSAEVTVRINVPRGAYGFYGAAIAAQTYVDPNAKGIATIIRFLIPILLEVQGRSVQQRVELADTGMAFQAGHEDKPGTTLLSMTVVNSGQTLTRIAGETALYHLVADQWRRVFSAAFKERSVIPGVTITRTSDLERRLPSGKYRVETTMHAGGRRYKPLTKEIDFAGDPTVGDVPVDVPFVLDPPQLEIQGIPGARRSAYLTIENPTDGPLDMVCSVLQPKDLQGVSMGEIKGDDFSCNTWTEIKPDRFTFPARAKRKIAVQVAYPKPGGKKPYYYGTFKIAATYLQGQLAGSATGLIIVQDQSEKAAGSMQGMGMSLAHAEGEQYSVLATFGNTGNVHLAPKPLGSVVEASDAGMRPVQDFDFDKEPGLLLPLGMRRFSGVIDFSKMGPGVYVIKAAAEHNGGKTEQTLMVRVSESKEEGKAVDVIKPGEEVQKDTGK